MIRFTKNKPCFNELGGNGIQLLPKSIYPYVIKLPIRVLAERLILRVHNIFGESKEIFNQRFTSLNYLSLKYIDYDDYNKCYLELIIGNEVYYSQLIRISSHLSHLTTRVDYKCKDSDVLLSTQLQMFKRNEQRALELDTYYEVSTKRQVSYVTSNALYFRYMLDFFNLDTLNDLLNAFSGRYVYFDFDRVNLFSVPEQVNPEGYAQFVTTELNITKLDENIKPIYILGTEQNYSKEFKGYDCNYSHTITIIGDRFSFTGGKFYEEFQGEIEPYIIDDTGKKFTEYFLLSQSPPDLFTYTTKTFTIQKAISTENNNKIKL